jgi:hypothetical protein
MAAAWRTLSLLLFMGIAPAHAQESRHTQSGAFAAASGCQFTEDSGERAVSSRKRHRCQVLQAEPVDTKAFDQWCFTGMSDGPLRSTGRISNSTWTIGSLVLLKTV